jgi:toxin ParE1/3/4
MGEVRWSRSALRWLHEIHDYIAEDNPEAARRTVEGILSRVEVLSSFPEIGQRYRTPSGREARILLYGHYRIAYRVVGDRDVQLVGIYHGALDLDRHLR